MTKRKALPKRFTRMDIGDKVAFQMKMLRKAGFSCVEIGKLYHVSRQRVYQILGDIR